MTGPGGKGRGRPKGKGGKPERSGGKPGRAPAKPGRPGNRAARAAHDRTEEERPVERRERPANEEVLYGRQAIHEALRAGRRTVHRVWAADGAAQEPWLEGIEIHEADADWITRRCGSEHHQGMCADVTKFDHTSPRALLEHPAPLIVALDEVQDPQNLGAIIRTAECAGATGVVICERRAATVTPTVAKASAGAVEHIPVAVVGNLADFLADAKRAGAWCYGAAGVKGAVPWTEPDWTGPLVLVMGAEGKGLRPRVAASCDALVALPLKGRIDSLNVSAAAAALLFEIVRSRS